MRTSARRCERSNNKMIFLLFSSMLVSSLHFIAASSVKITLTMCACAYELCVHRRVCVLIRLLALYRFHSDRNKKMRIDRIIYIKYLKCDAKSFRALNSFICCAPSPLRTRTELNGYVCSNDDQKERLIFFLFLIDKSFINIFLLLSEAIRCFFRYSNRTHFDSN